MSARNVLRRCKNSLLAMTGRRRREVTLLAIAMCIIVLLYWQRSESRPLNTVKSKPTNDAIMKVAFVKKEVTQNVGSDEIAEVRRSWLCRKGRCEQVAPSNSKPAQSLETCNMLCATTQLWPQPTGPITMKGLPVPVRADLFRLHIASSPSENVSQHLRDAFSLMVKHLRDLERGGWRATTAAAAAADGAAAEGANGARGVAVTVRVRGSPDPRLTLRTDESYNLTVSGDGGSLRARLEAHSFCGARHGLETLSQLVWWDGYAGSLLTLAEAGVQDAPRFHYRGLMLDTARNYFPLGDLLRTVDAMAAVKLNTFHWHVSDHEAFPLRLRGTPELARHGSAGARTQYSAAQVRALVRHARLRGVRVLLEVDAPAHIGSAWSWGPRAGFGRLALCLEEVEEGQLNPRNPQVYKVLEKIYAEIIQLTDVDDVFHLGGDEVSLECWARHFQTNEAAAFDMWVEFTRRATAALERANGGKTPNLTLIWSSGLTRTRLAELDRRLGVQVWDRVQALHEAALANRSSILSHMQWYLDCGFGSWRNSEESGHCAYSSWQNMYKQRPWGASGATWRAGGANEAGEVSEAAELHGVVGGEACSWSEQLDGGGLDARVWPRAAAVAERLWTDEDAGVTADVYLRLDTLRTRLLARGVHAAPLWPRWCTDNPHLCIH